jgi:hypothetical protein
MCQNVLALQLQIGMKTQIVSSHDTISVAAKWLIIIVPMGPMVSVMLSVRDFDGPSVPLYDTVCSVTATAKQLYSILMVSMIALLWLEPKLPLLLLSSFIIMTYHTGLQ